MDSQPSQSASRRFSFDTAAMWALSVTVALGAIVLIPSASIPFLFTKVSLFALGAIVTLVLYVLARLTRGNVIVPPLPILGALWLLPLAYGLSTLFSGTDPVAALFGTQLDPDTFGFILVLAFTGTLAALIIRRPVHLRAFFKVSTIAFSIIAVIESLILVIGQFAPAVVSPATSIVGSFEDLGMVFGLGIAFSLLAARFLDLGKRTKLLLVVTGIIALIFTFLVNSTVVWVLLALVSLGLFVEAVMSRRGSAASDADLEGAELLSDDEDTAGVSSAGGASHSLGAPLVVLVVALFVLIGGSTLAGTLDNALGVNVLNVRPSWQSTLAVGGHAIAASPLFGSGPGTFGTEWLKYRDASLNSTVFWNIDFISGIGYIPTSFVTTGILGALAWLAFIGALLYFGLNALIFKTPEDVYVRFVSIATFVGALFVLALSIFSTPGPVVLIAGFVFIGIFVSTLRYAAGKREWGVIFNRSPRIGFVIVFALTLVLLGSIAAAYGVIERYVGTVELVKAGNALTAGNLDAADAAVSQATLFAPTGTAYHLESSIAQARMASVANDTTLSKTDAQTKFQAALSAAIQAALTATKVAPDDYQNWLALGDTYAAVVPLNIQGAYDNAKTAYEHAETLNPTNPTIMLTLAQLEAANKNLDAARTDLQKAISLKNDYTQAIFLLSQVEVQAGHTKDALSAAEAAAYFAPTDQNVLFQVGILRFASGDTAGAIAALASAVAANPQFANARFFLAGAYAKNADYKDALDQMNAIAALSADNEKAVASYVTALTAGKNPFPANFGTLTTASSTPLSGQ
ncbi:MAG: tetratricopeptide repeat protein [Patescibacteria group bacterium]|nr:tetratricopeptide repeat protein [Patescibacteria group bacterium]